MAILTNPLLEFDVKTGRFIVITDYKTPEIKVLAGFVSDGVTVPRIARPVVSKAGQALPAALVHDWCYVNAWRTKEEADTLFYWNLVRCGVHRLKARAMYYAVKWFGRGNYK